MKYDIDEILDIFSIYAPMDFSNQNFIAETRIIIFNKKCAGTYFNVSKERESLLLLNQVPYTIIYLNTTVGHYCEYCTQFDRRCV